MIRLKNPNRWLAGFAHFAVLVLVLVVMGFVRKQRSQLICSAFNIEVDKANGEFIDKLYIYNELADLGIDPLEGQYMDGINLKAIERGIEQNPYVLDAEMYQTVGGALTLHIQQRKPLFRVFTTTGISYYVDETGMKMPLSRDYPARVIVATGKIVETYSDGNRAISSQVLRNIDTLAHFLAANQRISKLFTQIDVDSAGNLFLTPQIGSHQVCVGGPTNLEHKFENLLAFYRAQMHAGDLNKYALVDIRFQNQVLGIPAANNPQQSATAHTQTPPQAITHGNL